MCTSENLEMLMEEYLRYCLYRKRLDEKTVRAYRTDLLYFNRFIKENDLDYQDKASISQYVDRLHSTMAPRTVKRKIASLQAFYHYLIYEERIERDPLYRLDLSFKLPFLLPRYIPNHYLQSFYEVLYQKREHALTEYQEQCAVRDIAVIELLVATGLRISELCTLTPDAVNLVERYVRVHGKGNKERIIQLTEDITVKALEEYAKAFGSKMQKAGYFFVNSCGRRLSDQSVRNRINRLAKEAQIPLHITPHMFRHSFATSLVNQDVDIRCIQTLLGHSSIRTTEIYTHVNMMKQKSILENKNPRKLIG